MLHDFLYHPPDPADVARDWVRWRPVSREDALRACGLRPVAVLHRVNGRAAGEWLHPQSRFFRADGPFLFDGIRYYVYTGAEMGKLKGLKILPPGEEAAWEEADEQEPIPLGSPTAKVPPAPKKYAIPPTPKSDFPDLPDLPDLPDIPDIPDLPKIPDLPEIPELPTLPELPTIPELPTLPAMPTVPTIPTLPEMPTLPTVPTVPTLPDLPTVPTVPTLPDLPTVPTLPTVPDLPTVPAVGALPTLPDIPAAARLSTKEKRPIEIALVDADDKPLAATAFRLKLPDGSVKEGKSDADGFIRIPDNELSGDMELQIPGEEGTA